MKYTLRILILIISVLPIISLFTPGLPITHDGPDHVARIANFYSSLQEGILVPRWAANLNWGYGHPILMFLYPLPSYMASIVHFIGFPFVESTKIVLGFSFVASVFAMYLWLRHSVSEEGAFVGALLYGFSPYRFVDLYVRGALGEHVAFIFPPLVCLFLYLLSQGKPFKKNLLYVVGIAASFSGLVLAHNAIALMCIPVFILYGIYLMRFEVKKIIPFVVLSKISIILGFGVSSFFWIPAFFEGKYTLRDIVTAGEVLDRFVSWKSFFYSPWNFGGTATLSKSLGVGGIVGSIYAIFIASRIKEYKHKVLLIGSMSMLFLTLVIMTELSKPVWVTITLLQKFQFPWRFLSVTTFLIAVIGGVATHYVQTKVSKNIFRSLFIGYCLLIIFSTAGMWHPKRYEVRKESAFTGIYLSTTDTGESSPIWSIRFMEHTAPATSQVITGTASITQKSRTITRHEYLIDAKTPSRIVEHTLYFPGWNIYVDGNRTPIQFQDPEYRGLMTYDIVPGVHTVSVQFENTKVRTLANYISILSILICILGIGISQLWKTKK